MLTQLLYNFLEKLFLRTFVSLTLVILLGIIIRVYFTPWDLPTNSPDAFSYMIEGLAYARGDFSYFSYRPLWPMFLSGFFTLFKFEDYFGYITIMRIVSISISVLTIPVLYLISSKFLEKKYAILATIFFTVESNLVENSIFGITEPIFIILGLISFYCAINGNRKYLFIGFIFAGLAFDTRLNGIVLFIVMLIACKIHIKNQKQLIFTILSGVSIFLIVSFPHIIDPLIHESTPFPILKSVEETISNKQVSYSTLNSGPVSSSLDIIKNVTKNEFLHIFRISLPFLILLFPFGMIIALKEIDHQKIMLFLCIIISLIIALPQYTISNEYRNLFFITPFLVIFASLGVQKLTVNMELKKIFLILFICGIILLSGYFLNERYKVDKELIMEKDKIGKYIANNFHGRIMGHHYLETVRNMYDITPGLISTNKNLYVVNPGIPMDTIDKLMDYSIKNHIDFLIMEDLGKDRHFPIFASIINNDKNFPYLEKMFDSSDYEYKKIHTKIYKINYSKYDN